MVLRIPLEVDASGNQKTVAQLLAIQQQIEKVGKSANGISSVAQALNTTYVQAKRLSEGIGLTGTQTAKAVASIRVLVAAGADTESRFSALSEKLGITRNQFDALEKSVAAYNIRQSQIAQGSKAIEATLSRQQQLLKQNAQTPASAPKPPTPATKSGGEGFDPKAVQGAKQSAKEIGDAASEAKGRLDSIFQGIGKGAGGAALAFTSIVSALQLVTGAAQKAYSLLIGQNTELQQQLLGTQSTLAATNKVFENGVEIKDPTQAIQALEKPVLDAVARIRQGSLELVGVTSAQLIPLFQVIAGQGAEIGANLNQSADLALDFGAALGTLGIPLDQARQEILSILQGQVNSDSQLAKSIGLTNQQINQYKQQGTLVTELQKRLSAFRAGNALAAQTIGGVTSNIQELAQEFTRLAGEPLLEPLVGQLNKLYQFLNENKEEIQEFSNGATEGFLAFATSIGESVDAIANALTPVIEKLGPTASGVVTLLLQGFQSLVAGVAQLTVAIAPALEGAAELSAKSLKAFQDAQQAIGLLTGATNDSTEAISAFADTSNRLGGEAIQVQGRLKAAIEARAAAQNAGRKLTDEEAKAEKAALQQKDGTKKALEQQLLLLNQAVAIGPENVNALNAQKTSLKARIDALEKDSTALEKNAGAVKLVANKNKEAEDAVKKAADATKDRTEAATLAETKAESEVARLQANGSLSKDAAEKRKLAITKDRIQAELAAERSGLSALEALPKDADPKKEKARQDAIQASNQKIAQLDLQANQNRLAQREADEKVALDKITTNNQKAQNEIAATYQQRELRIQTQLNNGVIDEQQAQEQRLKATADRIAKELALEKQLQSQVANDPNISQDEKEKRQVESAKKIADLQLAAAQNREAVEKATVARIVAANEKAQSAIANATKQREIEIQTLLNKGVIDDAEAQRLKLNATADRIAQELALEQKLQAQIASDPTVSKGEKEKQQAASLKKIADLQLASVQNREAIEKAALDRIVAANQEAEAKIADSQSVRTTQIKQAVLDRRLSEEDATKQLEQIALEASDQIVAAKKRELAEIQAARASGSITIAQAAETEKQLQIEIGQATLQRIEAEIQARRKASELAIDASLGEQQRSLQALNQSRSGELGLLQAQSSLQESLNNLANERLNTQIAIAEASGNSAQADQLRLQALSLQESQQAALEESQNRELALKQEIRLADAQIAETEAEIALARAESAGASERELANLQRILDLRKKQVGQASELNTVDGKVLKANQATSREKSKQAQIQSRSQKQSKNQPETAKTPTEDRQDDRNIAKDGSRTTQVNKDGSTATLNKAVTQKAVTLSTAGLQAATDESGDAIKATAKSFDTTADSAKNLANAFDGAAAKVGTGQQSNTADAFDEKLRAQNPGVQGLTGARITELEDQIGKLANNPNDDFKTGRAKVEAFSRDLAKQGIDPRSLSVNLGEGQFKADILAALEAFRSQSVEQPVQLTTIQATGATPDNTLDLLAASALNLKNVFEQLAIASANAKLTPVRGLFTGGDVGAGETFIGNEAGAELIRMGGKTALLGDGTPGLFQADRPGYVFNAAQTAAILAGVKPGAIATTKLATATAQTNGGNDRAVVAQLQALRQDVANLQPDGGEYHFHREDKEALALTFKLQQGLQRARYRK